MPRNSQERPQQREDEGERLMAAQSERDNEREPECDGREKQLDDEEEREEIEAELEDLHDMEGPDA